MDSAEYRDRSRPDESRPTAFVRYHNQRDAFRFLATVLSDYRGIGLLYGPAPSGKSRLVHHFAAKLRTNAVVALLDGARMRPPEFLAEILRQLGDLNAGQTADVLYRRLCSIVMREAQVRQPPILIIENFNLMYPSALHVLCKLASLVTNKRFAVRIILVADQPYPRIIESRSMQPIAARLVGDFELKPMTEAETLPYLFARLRTFGVGRPDRVFVIDIATLLHAASGGWPVNLDRIAESIVDNADGVLVPLAAGERTSQAEKPSVQAAPPGPVPVLEDAAPATGHSKRASPKLIVTFDRKTIQEFEMEGTRAIIGRSDLSDIVVASGYVSRQHALLIRDRDGVVIIDLKSSNGTFVNSQPISSKVLRNNDIISIGYHRIKLVFPGINTDVDVSGYAEDDTATMQTADTAQPPAATAESPDDDRMKGSA